MTDNFDFDIKLDDDERRIKVKTNRKSGCWLFIIIFSAIMMALICFFVGGPIIILQTIKTGLENELTTFEQKENPKGKTNNKSLQTTQMPSQKGHQQKTPAKPNSQKEIFYKDKDGVWRNEKASTGNNNYINLIPTPAIPEIKPPRKDFDQQIKELQKNIIDPSREQQEAKKGIYRPKQDRLNNAPILPDALEYERFDDPRDKPATQK